MKKITILLIAITTSFAGFAQKAKANAEANKGSTVITTYSCPMHPDVTSDKPGKCNKCNMDLSLSKKEILKREVVKLYSCPMHTEVISDKPGKCSKCRMDLSLSKKEIMKREVVKLYTCPMDPDVIAEKDGTCPKCGMKLTEKKQSEDIKDNN
jgi:putative DNA topoisomerase